MDIFDKLMGRSALKKAEGPPAPAASAPPPASSTAQTDLAAAIAANPNNQPKPASQGFAGGAGGHSKIVNPDTHQGKLDGN